ncbi:(2,3-dihydroxybenzoyl)adenylate synthase [Rhodomicrobium vannielii ATCC 17100]|uniref:(2,3-dihydroxybenzoyl)adenylate synthase n=1 Tax=Rhodomicrobium vannielii TaxID=1069 RepID=UPI001917F6FC|nr:(2,3-dihydroxybenzoyl)adenylate synthase [Rhodomicrobium vannielii]MBJ7532894.1 (2,3-dihydroxybenzoyl)adenylate synthase [Rhodomicrobium vannielii ATCC 17100]
MNIEYCRWPDDMAELYVTKGLWLGRPLSRIIEDRKKDCAEALAIICGDRRFSYGDLDRLSSSLAGRLAARGMKVGDTALVQLPNVAEFYIVFFALLKIGVAPVNALFVHRKLELTAYARQIAPRLLIGTRANPLFSDDAFVDVLKEISPNLSLALFLGETKSSSSLDYWINTPFEGASCYAPSAPDEVAFFNLSGGSTATPKLIPRTHNDYDYSVRLSAEICQLTRKTRFLCALPAGHNYPMSSPGSLGVFHVGGCVVMASSPEPLSCFDLIERHSVNMVALVPPAVSLWLHATPGREASLKSLELLQVGGANFAEAIARRIPEALGCRLQQVFGMAEGLVNYTRLDDPGERVFTTQGRPMSPYDEIKIIDEEGCPVAKGEVGMLVTRGPYTFRGYYRSPQHNAHAFDDEGFYKTGDLVRITDDGNLRVVGRVKDQINRGGEKIAAEEVENLLLTHPDVAHAALIAIKDPSMGERSCAFVVTRNPGLKSSTLRRYLASLGTAEYKLPDRIAFIDAMPLTAVGKIDKKRLSEKRGSAGNAASN